MVSWWLSKRLCWAELFFLQKTSPLTSLNWLYYLDGWLVAVWKAVLWVEHFFVQKTAPLWLHSNDFSAWTVGWWLSERRCWAEPFFCTKNVALLGALSCPSQACHQKKSLQKAGTTWLRWVMDSLFGLGKLDHMKLYNPMFWLWILLTVFIC